MGVEAQRAREPGQASMLDLFGGGGDAAARRPVVPMPIINETQAD